MRIVDKYKKLKQKNPRTGEDVGNGSHSHGSGCSQLFRAHFKIQKKQLQKLKKMQKKIRDRNQKIEDAKSRFQKFREKAGKFLFIQKARIRAIFKKK